MYRCKECNHDFDRPLKLTETHGLRTPPFEKTAVCPFCKGTGFYEKEEKYCRCCGAKITGSGSYCGEKCAARGEQLRRLEQKRRKAFSQSPLCEIVRETDEYNKMNNTNLSYGQFVAFVRPSRRRGSRRV